MRTFPLVAVVVAGALPWAGCDFGDAYSEWCHKNGCSDAGSDAQVPEPDAAVGPDAGGVEVTRVGLESVKVTAGGDSVPVQVRYLAPAGAARTDLNWYVSAPPQTNPPHPPTTSADAAVFGRIDLDGNYYPPAQALSGCRESSPAMGCPTLWAVSKDPSCVHREVYDCWDYTWAVVVPPP